MKQALRFTPQTKAVLMAAQQMGHASNLQLLDAVLADIPSITATTVHRITKRLVIYGLLARGPEIGEVILIDSNLNAHDHFICMSCKGVKDVVISGSVLQELRDQTGAEILPSSLIIYGDCKNCGR